MKDISGYEGRYAVTEDGRVWSYGNKKTHKAGLFRPVSLARVVSVRCDDMFTFSSHPDEVK